jgi:hypothetical protein
VILVSSRSINRHDECNHAVDPLLRLNRNGALDRFFPNRVLEVFPIVFPETIQTTD